MCVGALGYGALVVLGTVEVVVFVWQVSVSGMGGGVRDRNSMNWDYAIGWKYWGLVREIQK
ncbi:hypothetical protein DSM88_22505 [Salmonella enterica subsp. enterica]|nr:hypothetical protein [Salmonella enterica subsp. enterica]